MQANWGYQDGSGKYFITIDTDKCDGCGKCVEACPYGVLEIGEDPADPMRDEPVAFMAKDHRQKVKYWCSPCKAYLTGGAKNAEDVEEAKKKLPCIAACEPGAITHSW
jgi:Fe-S-cluster-containing dehydrogenase component